MQETQFQFLGQEDPLEKETATHSNTLAWEIPGTEEPSKLQSMGSQRVRHDLGIKQQQKTVLKSRERKKKQLVLLTKSKPQPSTA